MFYSSDILSKGNSLSVIWIAATLGARSSAKKLSKKEVLGVNITKACEFLEAPPEPLALRLTSNLMVGVARVLSSQYTFYLSDVNNVLIKLKKSFNPLQTANIDMAHTEVRNDLVVNEFNQLNLINDPELDIQALINASFQKVPDKSITTPPHSSPSVHHSQVPQFHNSTKAYSINLSERQQYAGSIGFSAGSYGNDDATFYQDYLDDPVERGNMTGVDVDWTLDLEGIGGSRLSGIDFRETEIVDGMTGFGVDEMQIDPVGVADPSADHVTRKPRKQRVVKLVDDSIEIPAAQMAQIKEQTDQLLDLGEQKLIERKRNQHRAAFVKESIDRPSLIHNPVLVDMYKKLVKPFEHVKSTSKPTVKKRDAVEAFGVEAPRFQDDYLVDGEVGFGNQSLEFGSPELARGVQVEAPWAHTPSISRQSGISYSGGDQFSFEKLRVSGGSLELPSDELDKHDLAQTEDDPSSPASDKETLKFYNYVKDIMDGADTEMVYLFDLIQGGGGKRVACQAFYHLLVLASRGDIKVMQEESFGDVEVTVVGQE